MRWSASTSAKKEESAVTDVFDGVVGDTDGADLALGELGHGYNGNVSSAHGRINIMDKSGIPFQVSTIETPSSMITSPPSTLLLATKGK